MRTNIDQKNRSNDGRGFERELEITIKGYRLVGRARLEKVEPPTRTVGGGNFRRVIYLANPFLDFIGAWTERDGRSILIEAKSTSNKRLPLLNDKGLKESQWEALVEWHNAGAAVGVLWHRKDLGRVCFLSVHELGSVIQAGAKSLDWGMVWEPVERGAGLVLHDFLVNLARRYPQK